MHRKWLTAWTEKKGSEKSYLGNTTNVESGTWTRPTSQAPIPFSKLLCLHLQRFRRIPVTCTGQTPSTQPLHHKLPIESTGLISLCPLINHPSNPQTHRPPSPPSPHPPPALNIPHLVLQWVENGQPKTAGPNPCHCKSNVEKRVFTDVEEDLMMGRLSWII